MIDLNKLIELISNTESLSRIFETNLEEIKPFYWKGKSPFKNENTPSFFVSKDKTIMYKCFATQKGGSLIQFIAEKHNLSTKGKDFVQIIKIICEKTGIPIEQIQKNLPTQKTNQEKEKIFYGDKIPEEIKEYLKKRGVNNLANFSYNKETSKIFFNFKAFPTEEKKYIIHHPSFLNTQNLPKYQNSPGKIDYTLYFKTDKYNELFLVEGLFDAIMLTEQYNKASMCILGVGNATNFSEKHLQEFKKYRQIIIAYDNDSAGEEAKEKTLLFLLYAKIFNLYTIEYDLPNKKYIYKDLNEAFQKGQKHLITTIFQEHIQHYTLYLLNLFKNIDPKNIEEKSQVFDIVKILPARDQNSIITCLARELKHGKLKEEYEKYIENKLL